MWLYQLWFTVGETWFIYYYDNFREALEDKEIYGGTIKDRNGKIIE